MFPWLLVRSCFVVSLSDGGRAGVVETYFWVVF